MRLPSASCIQSWSTPCLISTLIKHNLLKLPPSLSFTCLIRKTRPLTCGGNMEGSGHSRQGSRREDGFSVIVHIILRVFICIYRQTPTSWKVWKSWTFFFQSQWALKNKAGAGPILCVSGSLISDLLKTLVWEVMPGWGTEQKGMREGEREQFAHS